MGEKNESIEWSKWPCCSISNDHCSGSSCVWVSLFSLLLRTEIYGSFVWVRFSGTDKNSHAWGRSWDQMTTRIKSTTATQSVIKYIEFCMPLIRRSQLSASICNGVNNRRVSSGRCLYRVYVSFFHHVTIRRKLTGYFTLFTRSHSHQMPHRTPLFVNKLTSSGRMISE